MPIANYTTSVSVSQSTSEIQSMLAAAGASATMVEYESPTLPSAISFILIRDGKKLHFKLPANWQGALKAIRKPHKRSRADGDERDRSQAQRVAWRCVRDWVRAQLAMVQMERATLDELMLSYMITRSGETLYKSLVSGGFKQLQLPEGQ